MPGERLPNHIDKRRNPGGTAYVCPSEGAGPTGGVTVEIKGELDEGLTVLVIILGNLNNFHGMSGLLLFSATYPVRFEIKDLRRGLLLFEIITDI